MIARVWRGETRAEDAQAYAEYMGGSGGQALADTPGNRGVYILRRIVGDTAEFVMLSLWESEDVIHAFAGNETRWGWGCSRTGRCRAANQRSPRG
jgi:heme-degrading monooxygenase HmoA